MLIQIRHMQTTIRNTNSNNTEFKHENKASPKNKSNTIKSRKKN